jgi:Asp-tRNA(Asn)/Glu-tRNA(Gln) amidotransferase A subunit family amidase
MARTVTDAAIFLLGVLAGVDNMDAVTVGSKEKESDYLKYLDSKFLAGKRIGIKKRARYKSFIACPSKQSIDLIKSLGGTEVEIEYLDAMLLRSRI